MAELSADGDERDDTHFWVYCPGCAYEGKIGVPHNHPADVVVCPQCRDVVNVRPEDRILWRPASATEFLRARFPHNDWDTVDREPRRSPDQDQPPAVVIEGPAARVGPSSATLLYLDRPRHFTAGGIFAAATFVVMFLVVIIAIGSGPSPRWERRTTPASARKHGSQDALDRSDGKNANPSPPAPPIQEPPIQNQRPRSPAPQTPPGQTPAPQPPAAEPTPPPPPELAWRELFERARQRMKEGDYVQAVDDLNEVLRLNPDCTDALDQRVKAYFALRRFDEALADVNEQLRRSPTSYRPLVSRAVVNEALGNWRKVADDLDRAVRVAAIDGGAGGDIKTGASQKPLAKIVTEMQKHAELLFREGSYPQAASVFTVLARHLPGKAMPVFWRAACYEAMGAVDQALHDYDHALALPSPPAWAYVRRAILHERNGDFGAAGLDLRKAVQLEPRNRDYIERLKRIERKRRYHPRMYPVRLRTYPVSMRT